MEEFFNPPIDSQYPAWVNNYYNKVSPFAAIIGITATELEKLEVIRNALNFCSDRITKYDAARLDFIRTRQIIIYGDETNDLLTEVNYEPQPDKIGVPNPAPANVKSFIQNLVVRTRACPGLNEMQKKDLGVLPKPKTVPELQAVLKGELVNGQPVLECKLLGTNGFDIWRSVTGTDDFAYFDRSAANTYTDSSALPPGLTAVQYDYKVKLIGADNEPVTEFSNVVTLTKTA